MSSFPTYSRSFPDNLVCDSSNEECMMGKCHKCPKWIDDIKRDASLDEDIQWSQWERVSQPFESKEGKVKHVMKMVKVLKEGTVEEALNSLEEKIPFFLEHVFIKRKQAAFFEGRISQMKPDEAVVQESVRAVYKDMEDDTAANETDGVKLWDFEQRHPIAKYTSDGCIARIQLSKDDEITVIQALCALKTCHKGILGAQASYGGRAIDIVCRTAQEATNIAANGLDFGGRHYDLRVAKTKIHVSVFVPIQFPDKELQDIMARYGKILHIRRLKYKEADLKKFENGVRVIEFDTLTQAIPSRIHYAGHNIGIKYTGQPKTCVRCSSLEHLVRECPLNKKKQTPTPTAKTASPLQ
ncbi:hypothetical protein QZH41_005509 [Actinostola sp. cb2023]|nr:hypothetical protein QZH41_005509 [Actinostola sp. cb2023]